MIDQLTSYLFPVAVPRPPAADTADLRAQALDLLESSGRIRASWAVVIHHLKGEGFEAGEFALLCRVHLNLLDNCAVLLDVLSHLSDHTGVSPEKLRSEAAAVKAQQDEIRPLYELATRKPSPFDPVKFAAAERKYAGQPPVEVGELIRQIEAGEVGP